MPICLRPRLFAATGLLTLAALGAGCAQTSFDFINTAPLATILAPEDGQTVSSADGIVEFRAQVSDGEDTPEELSLVWTSTIDGELSTASADNGGVVSFIVDGLSYGEHGIELRATDTADETGTDSVTLLISPGAPWVRISEPLGAARFTVGEDVHLEGEVEDALGNTAGQRVEWLYWTDNPDDEISISGGVTDSDGFTALDYPYFPTGSVTLVLRAWDQYGGEGEAFVTIQIDEIPPGELDNDRDGFTPNEGDCDDNDPTVRPGADDPCDGIDNDCNGTIDDGFDADFDGWSRCNGDCDDNDPSIAPGISEICDGIDQNCNGAIDEPFDVDADGSTTCTGDCNDANPEVFPGAPEICDGIDNNCNGEVDELVDADGDGQTGCDGDCDDSNPAVYFGAPEVCDGFDNNCNSIVDEGFDADSDGYSSCSGDCDDSNAVVNPGAVEFCDGLDNNCNLQVDEGFDADFDGVSACDGDCNDADPAIRPGAAELCDGRDQDCDGLIDEDFDADGDTVTTCGGDCDDTDAAIRPGIPEVCDGLDNDCDFVIDEGFDLDGDGYAPCLGDCDDANALVHPGAAENCDAIDNNCDGVINEGFEGPFEAGETGPTSAGYYMSDVQPSVVIGSSVCGGVISLGFFTLPYALIKGIGGASGKFHSPDDIYDIYSFSGEPNIVGDLADLLGLLTGSIGSVPVHCRQGSIAYSASNPTANYTMSVYRDGALIGARSGNSGTVTFTEDIFEFFSDVDYRVVMYSNLAWSCTDTYTFNVEVP